ncbi:MAG: Hpt domain-containing protein [Planctomycetota bacterium]
MDRFSLDDVRESFEADVTANVTKARGSVRQALDLLLDESAWSDCLAAFARHTGPSDEGSALGAHLLKARSAESTLRSALLQLESACGNTESVLGMELAGRSEEAKRWGDQQVAELQPVLDVVRAALASFTESSPASLDGEISAGSGEHNGGEASLQQCLDGRRFESADLDTIGHCFHAIRGSSGMVDLQSLAVTATLAESLVEGCAELLGALEEELQAAAGEASAFGVEVAPRVPASPSLDDDASVNPSLGGLSAHAESSSQDANRDESASAESDDTVKAEEDPADDASILDLDGGGSRHSGLESRLQFGGPPAESKAEESDPQAPPAEASRDDEEFDDLDEGEFDDSLFEGASVAIPGDSGLDSSTANQAGLGASGVSAGGDEASLEEFEFDEGDDASVVASGGKDGAISLDDVDPELVEIFLEEARQCLGDLRESFQRVEANAADCAAWLDLSRHFHLLKGSAGTVGIAELAEVAGGLEEQAEAYGERKRTASNDDVLALRASAARMLATCDITLDEAVGVEGDVAQVGADGELVAVFVEEAKLALVDVRAILQKIEGQAGNPLGHLLRESQSLAALFHRLKGSAVLHGSAAIGATAAHLNDLLEQEELPVDAFDQLKSGVDELTAALGESVACSDLQLPRVPVTLEAEAVVWEAFQMEVQEFVEQLDRLGLELEESAQPREQLEEAFRCMHTLKGACNTVGLSPTGAVMHELESSFEHLLAADVLPPLGAISRLVLDALDAVRSNIKEASAGEVTSYLPRIKGRIKELLGGGSGGQSGASSMRARGGSRLAESLPTSTQGASATGAASAGTSAAGSDAAASKGRDTLRVSTERLDRLMDLIGELVVQRSQLRSATGSIGRLQNTLKKSRLRLFSTIDQFRERYEFFGIAGQKRKKAGGPAARPIVSPKPGAPADDAGGASGEGEVGFSDIELDNYEDINILARSLEEIDSDINQIQQQIDVEIESFHNSSDSFGALIGSLQNEITEARMVAVDQLFLRLRRPIRDAADRLQREVRVTTTGEDVTLDKTIIDQLYAPLLHLVRNAVSHGMEDEGERLRVGKSAAGVIHLAARQESGRIVLEVHDDGAGLDLAALHRKGVQHGLIAEDTPLDDPSVRDLIFVGGLSTKNVVDDVAGRGIGCDVVRRAIEHLSGIIDVVSTPGRGTTFRISMPLTLAIYRALLVKHSGMTFALPISFAERILDADETDILETSGVRRLRLDDQFLEMRDLSRVLGLSPSKASDKSQETAVILRLGTERIAVGVDQILGQDEIVVKSLGDVLTGHNMFSGVTIDGEGNLVLILDVTGVFSTSSKGPRMAAGKIGVTPTDSGVAAAEPEVTKRRVRILYADDSLSVRKAAEKFLGEIGADVELAVDGVDALERLRSGSYDMVFSDLEMPRMHGFELLGEMRYVPAFKDIPVVVVTSRSGDKHRQQAEKLGCNGYLAKPFTQAALQEHIINLTGATVAPEGLVVERTEITA